VASGRTKWAYDQKSCDLCQLYLAICECSEPDRVGPFLCGPLALEPESESAESGRSFGEQRKALSALGVGSKSVPYCLCPCTVPHAACWAMRVRGVVSSGLIACVYIGPVQVALLLSSERGRSLGEGFCHQAVNVQT
jgi:hypothetical protein